MRNITLALDDEVLEKARVVAAESKTTVNGMVREYLANVTGLASPRITGVDAGAHSMHKRMEQVLAEGRARYGARGWFDREEANDREYQRAEKYFENRAALLKLIDETKGDMGEQRWDRSALYDS